MTAIDFEKFVERLADVSGEAILPFFKTSLSAEDKSLGGVFDPVTEADRAAARSASVTGSNTPPNDLSSALKDVLKNGSIASPDTSARRSTNFSKSMAVIFCSRALQAPYSAAAR